LSPGGVSKNIKCFFTPLASSKLEGDLLLHAYSDGDLPVCGTDKVVSDVSKNKVAHSQDKHRLDKSGRSSESKNYRPRRPSAALGGLYGGVSVSSRPSAGVEGLYNSVEVNGGKKSSYSSSKKGYVSTGKKGYVSTGKKEYVPTSRFGDEKYSKDGSKVNASSVSVKLNRSLRAGNVRIGLDVGGNNSSGDMVQSSIPSVPRAPRPSNFSTPRTMSPLFTNTSDVSGNVGIGLNVGGNNSSRDVVQPSVPSVPRAPRPSNYSTPRTMSPLFSNTSDVSGNSEFNCSTSPGRNGVLATRQSSKSTGGLGRESHVDKG